MTLKRTSRGLAQPTFWEDLSGIGSEHQLAAAAFELIGESAKGLSDAEKNLVTRLGSHPSPDRRILEALKREILSGSDPLGDAFCKLRSPDIRRGSGATYTPKKIVDAMVDWAVGNASPARIVDPGCGSARFLLAAGRRLRTCSLVGIEVDPLAALLARANVVICGLADRTQIIVGDYRDFVERSRGKTLYIGNPPYVRHHQIEPKWKAWLSEHAAKLQRNASQLAGMHVHFFLATALHSIPGDQGVFITAAEWLDVNYGSLVRELLLRELGGRGITVIEPNAQPFTDAATTGAITTFEIGSKAPSFFFRRVANLDALIPLESGRKVHRDRLAASARWSHLTRPSGTPPAGYVELGELCRVHRGQVTGANGVWIAGEHSNGVPDSVLFRTVTRAKEVIAAAGMLDDAEKLRQVIDIPPDLDVLGAEDRRAIERFLTKAKGMGANRGYIASHRKAWWSVGLRAAAPIISTYMARRAPAFVLNRANARHINIAHGLYPRAILSLHAQAALVRFLQGNVAQRHGRTYAGGLTKFEPREMERLIVPGPELLNAGATQ